MKTHRQRVISEKYYLVPEEAVKEQYQRIMQAEKVLADRDWQFPDYIEMRRVAVQVLELAGLNLTSRSFNQRYGGFRQKNTLESVGGHTNLMLGMVMRALRFQYGPNFDRTDDGYTVHEIVEAVQRHDQPEIYTGDIADNGERNEDDKLRRERSYHEYYRELSPERDCDFELKVMHLLFEMDEKISETGRLLYVADKVAANIITLYYDWAGIVLAMGPRNLAASERDKFEMQYCDYARNRRFYASEMWAVDYFKARELVRYDETGYFTALLVMCTLLVNNNEWYTWRECDYGF